MMKRRSAFYHRMAHKGFLRHLLVRQASHTGEMLVDLITTTQEEHAEDIAAWCESLQKLPLEGHITGILHTKNDSLSDTIEDQGTEILYGTDVFTEELLGLRFKITPFSFFQTNSRGAEVLYETARAWLWECGLGTSRGSMDTIFDLYSGTGTIAQLMAPAAGKVIGVEIVEEAVRAARENAAMNGLTNCEFIAGDVLKVLDTIEEKPDLIILDPPRDGIHPKALPKILAYGVPYILYISCKPTSLARDIAGFAEPGTGCRRPSAWTSSPGPRMLRRSHCFPDLTR
jgi:23S rRNA (uracil1939-C5)-methyltransferase